MFLNVAKWPLSVEPKLFWCEITLQLISAPVQGDCYIDSLRDVSVRKPGYACTQINCDRKCYTPGGGGGYVPYGDVPPIRVYFLTFESETGCLFSSLTLKQGAKFVRSLRARVPIHSTVWHPPVGFNLFVFCPGN